jgi:predicted nucleic acid-binding protein
MASSERGAEVVPFPHRPAVDGWEQAIRDVERHLDGASTAIETYLARASPAGARQRRARSRRNLLASWAGTVGLLSRLADVCRGLLQYRGALAPHAAIEGAAGAPSVSTQARVGPPRPRPRDELRGFASRAAPYSPLGHDEGRLGAIYRQLVLAAAHENAGRFYSYVDCQRTCQMRWGLELERAEISVAVERLVEDRKLIRESSGYRLSDSSSSELAARILTSKEVETAAFGEWEHAAWRLEPSLSTKQMAQLREDLIGWLHEIIVSFGVKAAVLLNSEQGLSRSGLLEEIQALGFGSLPARDPVVALARPPALMAFLELMTPMQRHYLADLLATAHLVSVFTLDSTAHDEVRKLTSGQRIYLDTNVVYALLRLRGSEAFRSTRRALELSRQLGYELCITPWTLAELRNSVHSERSKLAHRPLPPAIAEIDLEKLAEPLLMSDDIEVLAEGCRIVDQNAGGLDEQVAKLTRLRKGPVSSRSLQEHDVKHRLLVEHLRGGEERRLSNAGFLFVTGDRALVRYAHASRRRPGEAPFAVLLADWARIVRSLTPRTDDYRRTMTALLETPSVRSPGLVSQAEVIEAIARINGQARYSSRVGAQLLLDDALGGQTDGRVLDGDLPPPVGETHASDSCRPDPAR